MERARERATTLRDQYEVARAEVDGAASDLSEAQRGLELARLRHGAAAAELRHVEALIASRSSEPELEAKRSECVARLDVTRDAIVVWEASIDERRKALSAARRRMGSLADEREAAEHELARLIQATE